MDKAFHNFSTAALTFVEPSHYCWWDFYNLPLLFSALGLLLSVIALVAILFRKFFDSSNTSQV